MVFIILSIIVDISLCTSLLYHLLKNSDESLTFYFIYLFFNPFNVAMKPPFVAALGLYLETLVMLLIFPFSVSGAFYGKAVSALVLHSPAE